MRSPVHARAAGGERRPGPRPAYYLYRLTGDAKYRAMGKEFFEDFVKHCRTKDGYAAIEDVRTMQKGDSMESFLFAETFKYYLLFAPAEKLDFDAVVFNTEAHPFKRRVGAAKP